MQKRSGFAAIWTNAEEWLGLSESDRNDMVREYHEEASEPIDEKALTMHAALHTIVENQIAMGTEPVPATVNRLIYQGLNRHEAIHAVAAVLSKDILEIMNQNQASWNPGAYRRRLEKLTAKRWRKGRW